VAEMVNVDFLDQKD